MDLVADFCWIPLFCVLSRGEALYPVVDNLQYGGEGKVPEANIDRLVADVEKQ